MSGDCKPSKEQYSFRKGEPLDGTVFPLTTYSLWGHSVEQLVEAMRSKPEGRGFHSRWYH